MLDFKLENCQVFGRDGNLSIGIGHGRILAIEEIIRGPAKRIIDMQGKFAVPGFIDSHAHLLSLGLENTRIGLFSSKTREDAIKRIKDGSKDAKRKIVVAYRWDESLWGETDYLTRSELDVVEKPVVAFRRDGHMATLNTAALKIVNRENVKDGVLKEEELRLLDEIVSPDDDERAAALEESQEIAIREGVTAVRDMIDRKTYDTYNKISNKIRIFRTVYDREVFNGLGVGNSQDWGVKTFLDGSIGARTAAHGDWPAGNLIRNADEFENLCVTIWSQNLPVAAHAIGENAVDTAVKVFSGHSGRFRNSIEHFELMPDGILERLNRSIVISSQPNFLEWAGRKGMYEDRLGKEWLKRNNPFRDILDAGLPLAFGSDTMPLGPMYGIHFAINSEYRQQRINLDEAIKCYTEGGAYVLGAENYMGKIEEGYLADMVFFDQNLIKVSTNLKNIKPSDVMVDGKFMQST